MAQPPLPAPLPPSPPPFRFGLIADIQASSAPDRVCENQLDYAPAPAPAPGAAWPLLATGTCTRRHAAALGILRQAAAAFARAQCPLVLVLGDVLDKTAAARSEVPALAAAVTAALAPFVAHYAFGNNDAATVGREGWVRHFAPHCTPARLYHSFSPAPGFRFIVLDAYDESTLAPSGGEAQARELARFLHAVNPACYPTPAFPPQMAWPPPWHLLPRELFPLQYYNGALGEAQVAWLEGQLRAAQAGAQRVLVFSHLPVHPCTCRPDGLAWNHGEVRALLERFPCVQVHIAGHDHSGGYFCSAAGVHYLVPPAPLECGEGEVAYGVVTLGGGGWELAWSGKEPLPGSATLQGGAWPKGRVLPYRDGPLILHGDKVHGSGEGP
jgi:manganese-dependent ADP-ribose/CDP-alcohol diphosphatase